MTNSGLTNSGLSISVTDPTSASPTVTAGTTTQTTFDISVTDDVVGDMLSSALSTAGGTCSTVTNNCGTLVPTSVTATSGTITGGTGAYTVVYTPPAAAFVTASTLFTITVSSNQSGMPSGSATITVNPAAVVTIASPPPPTVVAGTTTQTTFNISVSNDSAGDVLTPSLSIVGGGAPCSSTTNNCGTLTPTSITNGTINAGTGSYSVAYTPPAASFVTAATTFKLTISSSLVGSTPASTTIMVNPAPVVTVTPSAGSVTAGTAATTVNISVSNDVSGDTLTAALSGTVGGVACTAANGLCGSAGPSVSLVGISNGTGTYTVSYTPPASVPSSTAVTLTVTSSLAGSTAGTDTITVNPAGASPTVPRFLFGTTTTPSGGSAIAQFTVNGTTGQLRTNGYTPLNDGPLAPGGAIVIDSTFSYLYALTSGAVSGGGGDLHAFSIGSSSGTGNSGALTPIATYTSIGGAAPNQVVIDPNGPYVYVVTTSTSTIEGFKKNGDGSLTAMGSSFSTRDEPYFAVIDPTGKYLYTIGYSAGAAEMFTINSGTGALSELPESAVITGNQPVWMGIDPTGNFAYVVNQTDQTISQFTILQSNGTCPGGATPVFAGTLCPDGRVGPEASGSVSAAIAPSGLYFYTADEANTITAYSITPGTGVLGAPILNPTTSAPKSIFFDPTGANLYYGQAPSGAGGVLGSVGAFQVNTSTGVLTAATTIPPPTNGTASALAGTAGTAVTYAPTLALTSNINFPYNVSTFTINNPSTGILTFVDTYPDGLDPQYMATDPLGRYLYISDLNATAPNTVTAFNIDAANGTLSPSIGSVFAGGASPTGIVVDPSGQFVYVVNGTTPGTVSAFVIEPSAACTSIAMGSQVAGALCPAATPTISAPAPFNMVADSSGAFLYVTNLNANSISVFSIGPTGLLASVATTSLAANTFPGPIAIDPFSRFLYVIEESSNNIVIYSIGNNGKLTSVTTLVTNSVNLVNLTVDPLGRFLFAANDVQNSVLAYTIQQTGAQAGTLTAVANSPFLSPTSGGSLYGLAVDIGGQYLYVSDARENDLVQFMINQTSGALTTPATGAVVPTNGQTPTPVIILGTIH